MTKYYKTGIYEQGVKFKGKRIKDIWCTCAWGSIHRDHWKKGEQVCRHIIKLLKRLYGTKQNKNRSS